MEKRKNNVALRAAIVLCVLALFCAAFVGGTFAKYVSTNGAADIARVSKWGVTVTLSDENDADDLVFDTEYAIEDTNFVGKLTLAVQSSNTDNMVAPGTADAGYTFTIAGTPEVATKVDIDMDVNSDVYLGTTGDYGTAGNYYPLVFTMVSDDTSFGTNGEVVGTLLDVKNALETWADSAYYEPNSADLATTFTISWAWAYGDYVEENADENIDPNDVNDTKLGDLSAGVYDTTYTVDNEGIDAGDKWSNDVSFKIDITVTQVD